MVTSHLPFLVVPMSVSNGRLQDYMGGGAQPKQLVQEFIRAQGKSFAASDRSQVPKAVT